MSCDMVHESPDCSSLLTAPFGAGADSYFDLERFNVHVPAHGSAGCAPRTTGAKTATTRSPRATIRRAKFMSGCRHTLAQRPVATASDTGRLGRSTPHTRARLRHGSTSRSSATADPTPTVA